MDRGCINTKCDLGLLRLNMTKKDKLTIVPEQAKGRWYHLFAEISGQNAKVIFPHTDDVFIPLVDASGQIKNPEPNHIGVNSGSETVYLGTSGPVTDTFYFYKDNEVTKDDSPEFPISFIPTYKLVDNKYVKQDTGILCRQNDYIDSSLIINVNPKVSYDTYPLLQFDTRDFSLSNIVVTDVQTEDGLFGGIAHTSFEGEYYKVYLTKNVTSINVWIYGAFTT